MVTETYTITGMTCGHCIATVSAELSKLPGVEDVAVDLDTGSATVASAEALDSDEVRAAVSAARYALA